MAHKEEPSEAGNGGKVACTLAWGSAFIGVERGSLGFGGSLFTGELKGKSRKRGEAAPWSVNQVTQGL